MKSEGLSSLSREGVSIGVNLLQVVGGRSSVDDTRIVSKTLEWRRRADGSEVWGALGYTHLQWGGVWGPRKKLTLFFEMLNFYALWTLEQGDSTGTVIATMMFMTPAHQCRIDSLVLPIFCHCIIMLSCRL